MEARPRDPLGQVAGADGCPGGWICIVLDRETSAVTPLLCRSSEELLTIRPEPSVLAIDMPIGLPDAGDRDCDRIARTLLGPRRSSVFPAPIRPSLVAVTQQGADAISRAIVGRGVGAQAWGLYRRVLSLDCLIGPDEQTRCVEVHPELSFLALNGDRPMPHSKHSPEGIAARRAVIDAAFGPEAFPSVRQAISPKDATDDDLLDAMAACWTANRIAEGIARRIPDKPPTDSRGLRMEMWF
ncbi:DUF429 domain-containing protein [Tautonia marina]|uniref:DUF429 domain-containing protein n=1 Tax=Tautonia marina TaxID=2653855 RepID=UPI0012611F76|nr:DUF429 domain-containing protein [Tautonia marina]